MTKSIIFEIENGITYVFGRRTQSFDRTQTLPQFCENESSYRSSPSFRNWSPCGDVPVPDYAADFAEEEKQTA